MPGVYTPGWVIAPCGLLAAMHALGGDSGVGDGLHPSPATTLSQTWLSAHFLYGHESPKAFETLLANHIYAHAPATPAEELLVFRITQKAWLLRRLETWERVIADSRVAQIRQQHANAAAPACLALSLLEAKETSQTRFYERTAKLRQQHEAALDRLTAKLETHERPSGATASVIVGSNPIPASFPLIGEPFRAVVPRIATYTHRKYYPNDLIRFAISQR